LRRRETPPEDALTRQPVRGLVSASFRLSLAPNTGTGMIDLLFERYACGTNKVHIDALPGVDTT